MLLFISLEQGVYYYFYQIFRSRAELEAIQRRKRGIGDGSVGMFTSLLVAALSGYLFWVPVFCKFLLLAVFHVKCYLTNLFGTSDHTTSPYADQCLNDHISSSLESSCCKNGMQQYVILILFI